MILMTPQHRNMAVRQIQVKRNKVFLSPYLCGTKWYNQLERTWKWPWPIILSEITSVFKLAYIYWFFPSNQGKSGTILIM
jgi:hypothetical protein